jgi:hypothetical protein
VKCRTRSWGAKRPLIGFLSFLIFEARTRIKAFSTQALGIPPNRAFLRGQALEGATRGFTCTPGEGARDAASFRGTRHKPPHRPTSPISLSSHSPLSLPLTLLSQTAGRFLFHRRLHRRRRPCCLAASLPLPRIVIAEAVPRIEWGQASGRTSTAAYKMSVSTLNLHLVHSVSLHDVRRRALDDMHSRSARFRVEGQYYSVEVFSPFVALMMCAAARVRVRSVRCR